VEQTSTEFPFALELPWGKDGKPEADPGLRLWVQTPQATWRELVAAAEFGAGTEYGAAVQYLVETWGEWLRCHPGSTLQDAGDTWDGPPS
jgi:hypothetical protein